MAWLGVRYGRRLPGRNGIVNLGAEMKKKHHLTRLSDLLHEATLQGIEWDAPLGVVRLAFRALRRASDGSRIETEVEIALETVEAVCVAYNPACIETRPSEFAPRGSITRADLEDWRFPALEPGVWVNHPLHEQQVRTAALSEWLLGGPRSAFRTPLRICLGFDFWTGFGIPAVELSMLFACHGVSIASQGVPLSLADWESQYKEWWKCWKEHWDRKDEADDEESAPEDFAIPAGEGPLLDTTYRPPAEPVMALEPTDAPRELLVPIANWLEGFHARDWKRLSSAIFGWGANADEQLRRVEARSMSDDFGRWGYARAVDSWWIEGDRACVVVRGVEHQMPDDTDPAKNLESVWTIALRRIDSAWKIRRWEQGWPRYKSARALPRAKKPWADRWKSGRIEGLEDAPRRGKKLH